MFTTYNQHKNYSTVQQRTEIVSNEVVCVSAPFSGIL